jgi:hypothetical protein
VTRWPQQQTTTGVGTPRTRSAFCCGDTPRPGFCGTPRAPVLRGHPAPRFCGDTPAPRVLRGHPPPPVRRRFRLGEPRAADGVGHVVPALHFPVRPRTPPLLAEHGELVDATARGAEPAREKNQPSSRRFIRRRAAHSHAHCGVLAQSHARAWGLRRPRRASYRSLRRPASPAWPARRRGTRMSTSRSWTTRRSSRRHRGALLAALHPQS